jgi:hypothetical protein
MVDLGGKLEGAEAATQVLASIPDKMQRKVMKKAMSRATKGTVAAIRGHVKQRSGLLRKALGRKIKSYPKTMTIVAVIGARNGFGGMVQGDGWGRKEVYEDPAKIAHLVEFGTAPHAEIDRDGRVIQHPGAKPNPHMRPGYEETKSSTEEIFAAECEAGLAAELSK